MQCKRERISCNASLKHVNHISLLLSDTTNIYPLSAAAVSACLNNYGGKIFENRHSLGCYENYEPIFANWEENTHAAPDTTVRIPLVSQSSAPLVSVDDFPIFHSSTGYRKEDLMLERSDPSSCSKTHTSFRRSLSAWYLVDIVQEIPITFTNQSIKLNYVAKKFLIGACMIF